jgi:hypothetical protein
LFSELAGEEPEPEPTVFPQITAELNAQAGLIATRM